MLERHRHNDKAGIITGGGAGLGRVDEARALAVYLASDEAGMLAGQTLRADGATMSYI